MRRRLEQSRALTGPGLRTIHAELRAEYDQRVAAGPGDGGVGVKRRGPTNTSGEQPALGLLASHPAIRQRRLS